MEGASGTLDGSLGVGTAALFVVNHGARSSSVGLCIGGSLGSRRLVAATEHKDFALGLLGRNVLCREDVDGVQTDGESKEDTDVAPLVTVQVLVGRGNVGVAEHVRLALDGADGRAGHVVHGGVLVAGDRGAGHVGGTRVVPAVELVDHERLEAVGDGVQVVDPAAPTEHVVHGYGEASKDDQGEDKNGCRYHGLRKSTGQCGARRM